MAADLIFSGSLGLILGLFLKSQGAGIGVLIFGGISISLLFYFRLRNVLKFSLLVFIFAFGGFFYSGIYDFFVYKDLPPLDRKISFLGVISEEPKIYPSFLKAEFRLDPPYSGRVAAIADPERLLSYGMRISFEGVLLRTDFFGPYSVRIRDFRIISEGNGSRLKSYLFGMREKSLLAFSRYLPPKEAALAGGLLLGDRNNFSAEFKDEMKRSGTTHLVALSGYNIGILVIAFAALLSGWIGRKIRFLLTSLGILGFILMVGGEPSVVRAGIMGFLFLLSAESGRSYSMRHAIALAAGIMCLFDPRMIEDAGFILSFASLLGIVYILPALKSALGLPQKIGGFGETALMTVAAQAAVLPIIIQTFGYFSLTSILANILILPFVPLAMLLSFILILASLISPAFAWVVGILIRPALSYFLGVISFFAGSEVPFGNFFGSPYMPYIYYAVISAWVYNYMKNAAPHNNS